MPIYEYRCKKGHQFEVMQRMSEGPLSTCTTCGAPVQRVLHAPAVHFKGSGFYTTDYGKRSSSDSATQNGKSETKKETASSTASSDGGGSSSSSDSGSGSSSSKESKSGSSGDKSSSSSD